MSQAQVDKRFKYENMELIDDLYKRNRDIALISGHYGNWEFMSNFQIKLKHKLFCIYRPLKNKFVNKLVLNIRSKYGITMVPMKEVYRDVLTYKQNKEPIVVYFLGDQRPPRRSKFWSTFLNRETPFYTGFEKMAKKLNMAVVYMLIQKVSRGCYSARFELLYNNSNEIPDLEMTKKFIKTLENSIIDTPEYWLWSHNRWKHKREIVE